MYVCNKIILHVKKLFIPPPAGPRGGASDTTHRSSQEIVCARSSGAEPFTNVSYQVMLWGIE